MEGKEARRHWMQRRMVTNARRERNGVGVGMGMAEGGGCSLQEAQAAAEVTFEQTWRRKGSCCRQNKNNNKTQQVQRS